MSESADVAYVRLRALLRDEELRPGERVGDERSLAAAVGVPRAALRVALDRLEQEGSVRRTIGRSGGVLVADGRIERHLNTTEGLPEIARYQGIDVQTRVLSMALAVAGPRDRRLLQLPDGAAVHQLLRLRLADGTPLSLEASVLPADLFPGLAEQDLSSLYRTLRTVYDIAPAYSDETLEVISADEDRAAHLDVAPGTPLIKVQRAATGSTGRPIEVAEEVFRADRMRFHLRKYGFTNQHASPAASHQTNPPSSHLVSSRPRGEHR
ncbi:MAG: GntR family transcriptional regulator [Cellulomonadaceae bacterium]|nr:GntR family transcriptional regulator [Cellulomonadaceae bacterium]